MGKGRRKTDYDDVAVETVGDPASASGETDYEDSSEGSVQSESPSWTFDLEDPTPEAGNLYVGDSLEGTVDYDNARIRVESSGSVVGYALSDISGEIIDSHVPGGTLTGVVIAVGGPTPQVRLRMS